MNARIFFFIFFVLVCWVTSEVKTHALDEIPESIYVKGRLEFFDGNHEFEYWRNGNDCLIELQLAHGTLSAAAIQNGHVLYFSKVPVFKPKTYTLVANFKIRRLCEEEFSQQVGGLTLFAYLSFADPEWALRDLIANSMESGAILTDESATSEGKSQQLLKRPNGSQVLTVWRGHDGRVDRVDVKLKEQTSIRVSFQYNEQGLVKFQELRPGSVSRQAVYESRDTGRVLKIDLSKYDYVTSRFAVPATVLVIACPVLFYVVALLWNRNRARPTDAKSRSEGVTVIELLIALICLFVLLALTLPAVAAAREVSRATKCKSNVRQLALAVCSFRTSHRQFPSCGWGRSWFAVSDMGLDRDQPGGWLYRVSPYIEGEPWKLHPSSNDLLQSVAFDYGPVASIRIPMFHCPSKPDRWQDARSAPIQMAHEILIKYCQKPDYAMSLGPWRSGHELNSPPGPVSLNARRNYIWPNDRWLGIAKRYVGRMENEIIDGESMSILLGEKRIDRTVGMRAGDDQPYWTGCGKDTCRWTDSLGKDFVPFWGAMTSFGSSHTEFTVIARCDGSVHQESNSIDHATFARLGDISDGQ